MASTKYTYSIQNDFLNDKISLDRLQKEIIDSAILISIAHIDTVGDICDIWFKDILSNDDQIILSAIVSNHSGTILALDNAIIINEPKNTDGFPLVVLQPRSGSEVIYVSHNLCDKVTWFGDSIRIVDETLTNIDGYQFTSSHINWIDMVSGRVFDDDGLVEEQQLLNPNDPHGYKVIIKVDGYEKTVRGIFEETGGDYEVYFDDGYVKFFDPQSGIITASYSYENGSTFYIKPLTNTVLSVEAAEADFSDDITYTDTIEYSVWGYVDVFAPQYLQANGGPYPPGTKIPLKSGKYKRYTQILGEAIGSYPALSSNGVLNEHKSLSSKEFRRQSRGSIRSIQSVPFRYATTRDLDSRYGMELRLKLANDRVFGGETGTITFYCTSKTI